MRGRSAFKPCVLRDTASEGSPPSSNVSENQTRERPLRQWNRGWPTLKQFVREWPLRHRKREKPTFKQCFRKWPLGHQKRGRLSFKPCVRGQRRGTMLQLLIHVHVHVRACSTITEYVLLSEYVHGESLVSTDYMLSHSLYKLKHLNRF